MPYLGLRDGEEVIPPQVPDEGTVQCPVCDGEMYVKGSYYRSDSFVSRHFVHNPDGASGNGSPGSNGGSDCPGESETHHKMKAIAYARLEEDFPNAELELEGHVAGRFADVLLTFPEPRSPYGKGIAVEAQYRNKGKDIEGITEHYFEHSYSVAWLEEQDFTNHDVDLSGTLTLWPNALPDRRGDEGYSNIIRWLWQEKKPSVEREIPIPGEYWTKFDKTGEWVTIAERNLKSKGSARISRTPDGHITFSLGKAKFGGGSRTVSVQVVPEDIPKIRSFAEDLNRKAFGDKRPPLEECDQEWHELSKKWLAGSPTVTAWLTAALPDPYNEKDKIVVTLWKKMNETSKVAMQVEPYAVENLHEIANLLEEAFEMEKN